MAHMLDNSNGRNNIAYAGDVPWHGLGQRLTPDAPLETWRTEAGLDWHVVPTPICTQSVAPIAIPGHRALIRSDTRAPLSIVSDRYVPHQPKAVVEFFNDLISDFGFKMHTMGALRDGKQIWALAEAGNMKLLGLDEIDNYLLLTTSYDKSLATTAMYTSVRVVCNNTLSFAMNGERRGENSVRATHRSEMDEAGMKRELGLFAATVEQFEEQAESMARTRISDADFEQFLQHVFKVDPEALGDDKEPHPLRATRELYRDAPGVDYFTAHKTVWGAVNAVTRFQDHHAANRGGNRWGSATFGSGALRKARAWGRGLEMVEAA